MHRGPLSSDRMAAEATVGPTVLIASWLGDEHVRRIRDAAPAATVLHEPDLLPPPRYPADHSAPPIGRTAEQERRWRSLFARADILFDFDRANLAALPELAPRVRWIQATSAGIGTLMREHRLAERMPDTVFTTAAGIHAQPLAEFCLFAMLWFAKRGPKLIDDQRAHRWDRFAGTDLAGRTLLIVGMGAIGTELARVARAFRMRTIGIKRTADGVEPASLHVDELHAPHALRELLPRADVVALIAPHTPETERMIGARELALMRPAAVLVNIGRGVLVDEGALVQALREGRIAGAALDVFETEPLPADSPLWDLPNVLVSPHSASTSDGENARLVELFVDNLERFLEGRALRNVYRAERGY